VTFVVCTRNRADMVARTLESLERQTVRAPVLVIDQGDGEPAIPEDEGVRVVRDAGRGLSRARNVAAALCETDWIAFLDDDVVVEPDWCAHLLDEIADVGPEVDYIAGSIEGQRTTETALSYALFPVGERVELRGRWVLPHRIGYGACFAVRKRAVDWLGPWDERLGPGVAEFPAADDMDFNYRLLAGGGTARLTPSLRAAHLQWRTTDEIIALYRGYFRAWAGSAMKRVRTGDPLGGAFLASFGFWFSARKLVSAFRLRSAAHARQSAAVLIGMVHGIAIGARRRW
jgi:GT2 family glycosyltransferase